MKFNKITQAISIALMSALTLSVSAKSERSAMLHSAVVTKTTKVAIMSYDSEKVTCKKKAPTPVVETAAGAAIGVGVGGAVGAGIGSVIGGKQGTFIGGAAGALTGAGVGALIGSQSECIEGETYNIYTVIVSDMDTGIVHVVTQTFSPLSRSAGCSTEQTYLLTFEDNAKMVVTH